MAKKKILKLSLELPERPESDFEDFISSTARAWDIHEWNRPWL